jgi:hypothetical protein
MTRFRTLSASTVLIAALALAVSGCGGSNTAATTSHKQSSTGSGAAQSTSTPATTASSPPTTTATTSTATTSTSTSTAAASGGAGLSSSACTAADLTPAFLNSNGATGHVVIAFVLKNTGSSTCHTYGFPGVEFLTKSGAPITTNATRTTTDFAGHLSEVEVTVPPGSEASFRLVTSDVASSQSACQTARGLQIYAPDDTTPMKTTMPVGISVCNGTATVSPVVAGTGASST